MWGAWTGWLGSRFQYWVDVLVCTRINSDNIGPIGGKASVDGVKIAMDKSLAEDIEVPARASVPQRLFDDALAVTITSPLCSPAN